MASGSTPEKGVRFSQAIEVYAARKGPFEFFREELIFEVTEDEFNNRTRKSLPEEWSDEGIVILSCTRRLIKEEILFFGGKTYVLETPVERIKMP